MLLGVLLHSGITFQALHSHDSKMKSKFPLQSRDGMPDRSSLQGEGTYFWSWFQPIVARKAGKSVPGGENMAEAASVTRKQRVKLEMGLDNIFPKTNSQRPPAEPYLPTLPETLQTVLPTGDPAFKT